MRRAVLILGLLLPLAACVGSKSGSKAELETAQKVMMQVILTAAPATAAKYVAICAMTYTSQSEVQTLAANEATPLSRETVDIVRQVLARPNVIACIDGLGFGVPQP